MKRQNWWQQHTRRAKPGQSPLAPSDPEPILILYLSLPPSSTSHSLTEAALSIPERCSRQGHCLGGLLWSCYRHDTPLSPWFSHSIQGNCWTIYFGTKATPLTHTHTHTHCTPYLHIYIDTHTHSVSLIHLTQAIQVTLSSTSVNPPTTTSHPLSGCRVAVAKPCRTSLICIACCSVSPDLAHPIATYWLRPIPVDLRTEQKEKRGGRG
ncbi:hypothetical protein LX32DRAFT_54758 [Colletotrichum zoysiae]|uniref:Uncharacterized protein n=1 Tax=Colletotrichum zoysiae TaxID=1216348 RepID=A0AAD9HBV9_9PEZI|nr:hypothetical protein LX32DRAFT_54758 [Colletotrichum zoysiae]